MCLDCHPIDWLVPFNVCGRRRTNITLLKLGCRFQLHHSQWKPLHNKNRPRKGWNEKKKHFCFFLFLSPIMHRLCFFKVRSGHLYLFFFPMMSFLDTCNMDDGSKIYNNVNMNSRATVYLRLLQHFSAQIDWLWIAIPWKIKESILVAVLCEVM